MNRAWCIPSAELKRSIVLAGEDTNNKNRATNHEDLLIHQLTATRIDMEAEAVDSVYLDAGIGETELLVPDGWIHAERSFLVGSETSWRRGPGDAQVHVDVGVGEIVVRLD
jgi:hypothetical protein